MKFLSRSSFRSRATRSNAYTQVTRSNLSDPGLADLGIFRTRLGMHEVKQGGALRAERASVYRMIGIDLDVQDRGLGVLRMVSETVDENATSHGTIRTSVARLGRTRKLVRAEPRLPAPALIRRSQKLQASSRQLPRSHRRESRVEKPYSWAHPSWHFERFQVAQTQTSWKAKIGRSGPSECRSQEPFSIVHFWRGKSQNNAPRFTKARVTQSRGRKHL